MTEEEIKQLQDKVVELEKQIIDKDVIVQDQTMQIETLKNNAKEQAHNFKKLRDMTEQEKELYTEKEIELMKRQEAYEESQKRLEDEQRSFKESQRGSVIDNLANKYAKGDKDIAEKIKINLNRLKDSDTAITEQDLAPFIETSVAMLGNIGGTTDPLRDANNFSGRSVDIPASGDDFAKTEEGQQLGQMLGLNINDNK